ncbi:hypothetical protein DFH11DRAFT_1470483, partial [Phellopilus nigrolimitatus]
RQVLSVVQITNAIYLEFEGIDFCISLTRAPFEEYCPHLFCSTLEPVEKVLRDPKIDKVSIHEIVLVSGLAHTTLPK